MLYLLLCLSGVNGADELWPYLQDEYAKLPIPCKYSNVRLDAYEVSFLCCGKILQLLGFHIPEQKKHKRN